MLKKGRPPFKPSYKAVESLLADLHDVSPKRLPALRARLKHLKRLGFPAGVNTGRGRPADYNAASVLQLMLALELVEIGLTPERAINLIRHFGFVVVQAAFHGSKHLLRTRMEEDDDFFFSLDPKALAVLTEPESSGEDDDPVLASVSWDFSGTVLQTLDQGRRRAFVNVTKMLIAASRHLEREGVSTRESFSDGLLEWAMSFPWEVPDGDR